MILAYIAYTLARDEKRLRADNRSQLAAPAGAIFFGLITLWPLFMFDVIRKNAPLPNSRRNAFIFPGVLLALCVPFGFLPMYVLVGHAIAVYVLIVARREIRKIQQKA
jgi:hypothetical protein